MSTRPPQVSGAIEASIPYRKIALRIMPILCACYVAAYIDRTNIGFAKLGFTHDLAFTETVYGLGAGLFYLGYVTCEIPSNLYMARVGMRRTLVRIMLLWSGSCAALALMQSPAQYYALRILLGAAEAGLAPGVFLYLTYWIPAARRARFTALFMASVPIAGVIGGPLAGVFMGGLDGWLGIPGWRWLLLIEGMLGLPLAALAFRTLTDRPINAHWLSENERSAILKQFAADAQLAPASHATFGEVLRDARFYLLVGLGFGIMTSMGGLFFWLPTIIRRAGVESVLDVGLLAMVPFAIAIAVQYIVAVHSDRVGERRWHAVLSAFAAALGWGLAATSGTSVIWSVVFLTLAAAGTSAATGIFWALPGLMLRDRASPGGIALVTSLAGFGNLVSPPLVGWLADRTGTLAAGQVYFGLLMAIGGLMLLAGTAGRSTAA